jgi:quinol monooxygenase YgiN
MAETLRVVARVTAAPDQVDAVRLVLVSLIEPTRSEAGCISYELLQNTSSPADFTFVEEWQNDDALDMHMVSDHLRRATSGLEGLLAEAPDIRRYRLLR